VGIPRSLSSAAMLRSDVTPLARKSAMTRARSVAAGSARARRFSPSESRVGLRLCVVMLCGPPDHSGKNSVTKRRAANAARRSLSGAAGQVGAGGRGAGIAADGRAQSAANKSAATERAEALRSVFAELAALSANKAAAETQCPQGADANW
jgi:hypothetical protein